MKLRKSAIDHYGAILTGVTVTMKAVRLAPAEVAKLAGPKKADAGAGKKFIIDHLYVRNAKASYSDTVTLPIPDLHLRDVGKKTNGATAGEVLKEVWGSLSRGATGLASRALDAVKDGANSVLDGARKLFK